MARTPSGFSEHRDTKAAVSEPAPASTRRTALGSGPNIEAMKSATGEAARKCPGSSCLALWFAVAAIFMWSGYQPELRFAIGQEGLVCRIERLFFTQNQRQTGVYILWRSWPERAALKSTSYSAGRRRHCGMETLISPEYADSLPDLSRAVTTK